MNNIGPANLSGIIHMENKLSPLEECSSGRRSDEKEKERKQDRERRRQEIERKREERKREKEQRKVERTVSQPSEFILFLVQLRNGLSTL